MNDSELDRKMELGLLRIFVQYILNILILESKIDMNKANDPKYLVDTILENSSILDDPDIAGITEIHHEFIDAAEEAIRSDKPIIAVVLLSTAVEQILNLHYRIALQMKGLSNEDITQIIKRSNFDVKTGWLTTLVFGLELSDEMKKRILELIEIRNSIVHYKAVPGRIRTKEDSYSRIKERIGSLDMSLILTIPTDLKNELNEMMEKNELEYKAAKDMSEIAFKFYKIN